MELFLKILSIIGLSFLIILIVILCLLLIVLFVPVRYGGNGTYKDNKLNFSARVTWLFGFLNVKFIFGDDDPFRIKLLFFRLNPKNKRPKKEKIKKEKKKKIADIQPNEIKPDSLPNEVMPETESVNTEDFADSDNPYEDILGTNNDLLKKKRKERKNKSKKIKINSDSNKPSIYDKIKKYLEIIESKRFKRAYNFCKYKIKKLLKHTLPRQWDLNAVVGFDDPSTTGNILVYSSMLYPFIAKHIHIKGDFENERIEAELKFKGHITVFSILWIGITVYFNKDIKKLIKLFKEV